MMIDNKNKRLNDLHQAYERQPYSVELDGLTLNIDKGVFPPDVSFATLKLGEILKRYKVKSAIDIGSGSGYLAFIIKRNGVDKVYATDINKTAVSCIKKNIKQNPTVKGIKVIESDLFKAISSGMKFDIIVFNHFYRPEGIGIFGPVHDGGKVIVSRFLLDSKSRLNQGGSILMTFMRMSDPENDPRDIALKLGYKVKTLFKEENYRNFGDLFIYEIKMNEK